MPALRRLEEFGFIVRGEKLERNKQEFQLTPAGKRELKTATDRFLRQYQEEPPTDNESVLRVCAIALAGNKTRATKKLLRVAAQERASLSRAILGNEKKNELRGELSSSYRQMMSKCSVSALAAESMALSVLIRQLERKHRKRTALTASRDRVPKTI